MAGAPANPGGWAVRGSSAIHSCRRQLPAVFTGGFLSKPGGEPILT
jgi:hypothetical protein